MATAMKIRMSTLINVFYFVLVAAFARGIFRLIIWSFGETMKLSGGVIGESFASDLAILVQIGPLVCLLTYRLFNQHGFMAGKTKYLIWLAVILNLADMVTNILAYELGGYRLPTSLFSGVDISTLPAQAAWVLLAARGFGYFVCFAVTWGEEGLIWMAIVGSHLFQAVLKDLGFNPPAWLALGGASSPKPKETAVPAPVVNQSMTAANGRQPQERVRQ